MNYSYQNYQQPKKQTFFVTTLVLTQIFSLFALSSQNVLAACGDFTTTDITTTADGAYSVSAVDMDGDGDIDILSASYLDNKTYWYDNDGSENFTRKTVGTSTSGPNSALPVDMDGDGAMGLWMLLAGN